MESGVTKQAIAEELLRILFRDVTYGAVASWITALLFVYGLSPVVDSSRLIIWFGVLSAGVLWISLLLYRFSRKGTGGEPPYNWLNRLRPFIVLFTAMWMVGILLFFPDESPLYQSYLIIVIAGVTAGGIYALSADLFSARVLIIGTLTILALRLFEEGERIYIVEGILVLIYLILMLLLVERFHRQRIALLREWLHARDNSERLQKSRTRLTFLFDSVPAGILYFDRKLTIVESNAFFHQLFPKQPGNGHGDSVPLVLTPTLHKALESGGREIENELILRHPDGHRWIRVKAKALSETGRRAGAAIITDISEEKKRLEKARYAADHDPLTRLPNRSAFLRELGKRISEEQYTKRRVGVLFIDMDDFKPINDHYGHQTGDRVLVAVGRRLRYRFRRKDMVARYGGDEFVILMSDLPYSEAEACQRLRRAAEDLIRAFETPLGIEGREYAVGLSIGIALSSGISSTPESLVRSADEAMYRAKKEGKNRFRHALDNCRHLNATLDRSESSSPGTDGPTSHHRTQ